MSLLRISAAIQSLCTDLGTDEAAVKSAAKEVQTGSAEETKVCPEREKRWFDRGLKALVSILQENTNNKVVTDEHPNDSTAEDDAQTGKAKCHLGRGMRVLLRD